VAAAVSAAAVAADAASADHKRTDFANEFQARAFARAFAFWAAASRDS